MKSIIYFILFFCFIGMGYAQQPSIKIVLFPFKEAVISSRIDSFVLPYNYKLGEKFSQNSVLVRLDDARFQIVLRRVTEQYNFSLATYQDKKQLHNENMTSDFELRKSEFEYKLLENDVADAKLNLSHCTILAPFDGKLTEILTREYEIARVGQPLIRIIDDNYLIGVMNVPIKEKKLCTVGTKVNIALSTIKANVIGKVYEVLPQADHRTETIRVRVLIDNKAGKYQAGMTGELVYGK